METKDSAQYSTPDNSPKGGNSTPQLPGDKQEEGILKGAKNEDHLERLKPKQEADHAANEIGSPPNTQVNKGDSSDN